MYNNLYEFSQNNSGGSFVVDDKVCHTVVIQADSLGEANEKATELGIYFNGCEKGIDCSCCGDRWSEGNLINMDRINRQGYRLSSYRMYASENKKVSEEKWEEKYRKYKVVEEPKWTSKSFYEGRVEFEDEMEYLQFLHEEHGRMFNKITRIYFKDGEVIEIKFE